MSTRTTPRRPAPTPLAQRLAGLQRPGAGSAAPAAAARPARGRRCATGNDRRADATGDRRDGRRRDGRAAPPRPARRPRDRPAATTRRCAPTPGAQSAAGRCRLGRRARAARATAPAIAAMADARPSRRAAVAKAGGDSRSTRPRPLGHAAPAAGIASPRAPPHRPRSTLPTPLHAPDFAQALGVQLSVLASDGVQHAELHLNPAEMGPVSVQIAIDGTQAQVDFGADMAATRQAHRSRPAGTRRRAARCRPDAERRRRLAAVARPQRRRRSGSGARARGSVRGADGSDVGGRDRGAARRTARGGVDLYA